MKFELSQDVERWCQEALNEIDGMPAPPCEKMRAAAQIYQVKVLADISRKLSLVRKGKSSVQAAA